MYAIGNAHRKFKQRIGDLVRPITVLLVLATTIGCNFPGRTTTPATLSAQLSATATSAPATAFPSNTPSAPEPTDPASVYSPTPVLTDTPTPLPDYISAAFPLSQVDFVIPLTVRHVSEERATFFFELRSPVEGRLILRSSDPLSSIGEDVNFTAGETRHTITVQGLSAGQEYLAMVLVGNAPEHFEQPGFNGKEWGAVAFHTPSGEKPLRVGILGDASFGDQATSELVALMAAQDLEFVIHTGDVVYDADSSDLVKSFTTRFFEPFSPLLHQMPLYTVPGNHDYDANVWWQGAPFYDYAFPPFPDPLFSYPETRRANQYYAFAFGDLQFLMLDSQTFFGVDGRAEQDAWLTERLADARFRLTIPVFHVAPYSSSVVHPDDGLPVRYTWNPLFEGSKVPLSFSGHFHHYERLVANGITYIVSGGGSSTLYAQGELLPESQIYARRTHFVLMEIFHDHIELRAISKEGEILDQATVSL